MRIKDGAGLVRHGGYSISTDIVKVGVAAVDFRLCLWL
jgi:hypothetical protein